MQNNNENKKTFTYKDLNVLHEDNHIIVVVKPCNIPSQADATGDTDMLTIIKDYLIDKYNKAGEAYVGLVHRLDRPTGGVMVFAKTSKAAARLSLAIREGNFDKKYLAVVCGEPRFKTGKLEHYLKKNSQNNTVTICPMSTLGAKRAELDYKVVDVKNNFALVSIDLITGRSHQARVQMASLGTPIFGDMKYGADIRSKGYNLALWATEIKFEHPTTHEKMLFRVFPPTDLSPWKVFDINRFLNLNIKDVEDSQ